MMPPRTDARSICARPAAAVPPGEVTMRRRSEQLMPVSSSTLAVPTIVERISARAVEADSPARDAGVLEGLDHEAEERRARPRERRGGVEQPLLQRDDGAELPEPAEHARLGVRARERAAREAERARADLDPHVRHAAEQRHALLEHVLERRRGDAGRDRDDRGVGVDQLGGLAQHPLDVDRLDRDQDDVRAAHELGVVGDVLHAEALGQARRPPRAAIRHEDAPGQRRIGAQPALDHRAGHVAGADRAQYGRGVHASDGTCGRLAGTQACWLGLPV